MKKGKIKLSTLRVSSFVTAQDNAMTNTVKGGIRTMIGCTVQSVCNVCEGTEDASVCCPPIQ